jgi:hypothetical protein
MSDVAPGWYPDPSDPLRERLWDGEDWVEKTRPRAPSGSKPPVETDRRKWWGAPAAAGLAVLSAFVVVAVLYTGDSGPFNPVVGEKGPGGGVVFFVDERGFTCGIKLASRCTYLEAAPDSSEVELPWSTYDEAYVDVGGNDPKRGSPVALAGIEVNGADRTEIGSGYQNSLDIDGQNWAQSSTSSAAVYALEYSNNGKDDWYLPSLDETVVMVEQSDTTGLATSSSRYWTSTEASMDRCLPHNKGASYAATQEAYEKRLKYDCGDYNKERYEDIAIVAKPYGLFGGTDRVLLKTLSEVVRPIRAG